MANCTAFIRKFPFRVAIKKLHLFGKDEYKSEYYIYEFF
jgi:hypothetical protein